MYFWSFWHSRVLNAVGDSALYITLFIMLLFKIMIRSNGLLSVKFKLFSLLVYLSYKLLTNDFKRFECNGFPSMLFVQRNGDLIFAKFNFQREKGLRTISSLECFFFFCSAIFYGFVLFMFVNYDKIQLK